MEDWRARVRRESAEMERAIRAALALSSDEAVRAELERLLTQPQWGGFTWLWLPALAKRNRVMFRPFMLSSFDRNALDRNGNPFDAWKGESGAALEALLAEVDQADDIELTKRLYSWRLSSLAKADEGWRKDLLARFRAAPTSAARNTALAKVDPGSWMELDAATALGLYQHDPVAAKKFILGHLPWRPSWTHWKRLIDLSKAADEAFHFELYRRMVEGDQWEKDVMGLAPSPAISAQLQVRHPRATTADLASVFYKLLDKHGEPAVAYVKRHVASVGPRWGMGGQKEGKGVTGLLELANKRGWTDLWAALLRTSATPQLFDAEIKKLVKAGDRMRLEIVPGRGREFHGAGWSWSTSHSLTDNTACELYAKYPTLLRGSYRTHVTPLWGNWFPMLLRAAIKAVDHDLIDFMASRMATQTGDATQKPAVDALLAHYQTLPENELVAHAAAALSRIPAQSIWSYKQLVEGNELAKLLFEVSTPRYLSDGAAVRDLLESPQIDVQLLAFRILGQDDSRAREIAAANVDLLQATLLRRLHGSSRKLAFRALRNALAHDEATARQVHAKMRDALSLPEKRYPVEELVGLIGFALDRWPALRGAREQPVIYGATS